jgi:exosortase C (VPDSG-CTERM-specific)
MNPSSVETPVPQMNTNSIASADAAETRARLRRFMIYAVVLTAAFALPLWQLARHAWKTELQSHILLIPFVFWYLLKIAKGREIPVPRPSLLAGGIAALCGVAALVAYWNWGISGKLERNDALSLAMLSFLSLQLANALCTLGWPVLRSRLFAVAFLVFMIPLPLAFTDYLSIMLQRASAEAADWMLALIQMPFLRNDLVFQMPGLSIKVAEECSGVRSTFVLFITSLLAGHLFLRTGWKKALLAFAIFPLGILRNGFRITAISWLTVNVDPGIIDGPLHHHGGPFFFGLSLVPLFALLWLFRRSDFRLSTGQCAGS